MPRITRKDIEQLVNTAEVIDRAEYEWREKQSNKNKYAKWLDTFIVWALPVVSIVFYMQSAPHTASMANRITPNFGFALPLGFEFFIFLLSVSMTRGLDKAGVTKIYWGAIALTASLTIGGGVFSILENSGAEMATLSAGQIIETFLTLPFISQFLLLFVIPYGVFVTMSAKYIAELCVGIAMRDIKFNKAKTDIEIKWAEVQAEIYQNALFIAATKLGVAPKTALKWAKEKALSLTEFPSGTVSGQSETVQQSGNISTSPQEMGFVTALTHNTLTGRTLDSPGNGQSIKLTQKAAKEWARDNQDIIAEIVSEGMTKRETAMKIAVTMGYDSSSYKTIERSIL